MSGQVHFLSSHPSDFLMKDQKNPLALRLHDARHQAINVGDIVEYQGHNSVMDRQRFRVVAKMQHPSIQSAINQIDHSGLSARDRINMRNTFMGLHGAAASNQPVVSLHLEPHMTGSSFNRSVGSL